jgi:diaminopimelate epimerase
MDPKMTQLHFTKMHGLGNDFMVLDGINQNLSFTPEQISTLGNRTLGVGFDQLLVIERAISAEHDFKYRIFNADGSEVEQCGNGARCFARFIADQGLSDKKSLLVETAKGVIVLQLLDHDLVSVDMGAPVFEPTAIPFVAPEMALTYDVAVDDHTYLLSALSMGNPHAVLLVEDVLNLDIQPLGLALEHHPRFPQRVNVGFFTPIDAHTLQLRVFERSAGETTACGSGACAAAVAAIQRGLVASPVTVRMRGGELTISWQGMGHPVVMTGPAVKVFDGVISV